MNNILVTGGAGFIGSNFIRYLLDTGKATLLINLDALTYAGNLENLADYKNDNRFKFVKGDINDGPLVHSLLNSYEIDTIVHFAAETHVDRSIIGPSEFIRTNISGTFQLLEEARHFWIGDGFGKSREVRFHHISTDEVFGSLGAGDDSFTELTPYSPRSPYSASKAASDHLVRSYFHTYKLPISITNCSNNYGPNQYPEKLIPLVILNALRGEALPVYGDGQQIRDWLYVDDHCRAIDLVIEKGTPGVTYVVGGNNQPTNLEIIKMICNYLDSIFPNSKNTPHESLIKYVKDRPGHDRRYAMNISKINKELGWEPKETLKTGLVKTIQWYIEHQNWVEEILSRPEYNRWLSDNYKQGGSSR